MTEHECGRLKRGDGVVVSFGSKGTQYALVVRQAHPRGVVVRKWRQSSESWTGHVVCEPEQILRRVPHSEYANRTGLVDL
jgi:hypothetical protein